MNNGDNDSSLPNPLSDSIHSLYKFCNKVFLDELSNWLSLYFSIITSSNFKISFEESCSSLINDNPSLGFIFSLFDEVKDKLSCDKLTFKELGFDSNSNSNQSPNSSLEACDGDSYLIFNRSLNIFVKLNDFLGKIKPINDSLKSNQ